MAGSMNPAVPNRGAYPVRSVCQAPGDARPTLGVFGELLGVSRPQPDESGTDGAEACSAPSERICQCPATDGSPPDGQALPGRGVSDESAEKTPQHLSAVTRCYRPMTRGFA